MSDRGDEQDQAEAFDPDELGDDPAGQLDYPPEHRIGVERGPHDAVVPDVDADDAPRDDRYAVGRLVEAGGEDAEVPPAGDDEAQAVAWAEPVDVDLSAEEAAIHLTDGPGSDERP